MDATVRASTGLHQRQHLPPRPRLGRGVAVRPLDRRRLGALPHQRQAVQAAERRLGVARGLVRLHGEQLHGLLEVLGLLRLSSPSYC